MIRAGMYFIGVFLLIMTLMAGHTGFASDETSQNQGRVMNYKYFGQIPVMEGGRIKPLRVFSETYLLAFAGKRHIEEMDSVSWFAELVFYPQTAYERRIFKITHPNVVVALGMEQHDEAFYSFTELWDAFGKSGDMAESLHQEDFDGLEPAQQELLVLYLKIIRYFELSRSVSFLLPVFKLNSEYLAREIAVTPGEAFTYTEMLQKTQQFLKLLEPVAQKTAVKDLTEEEDELIRLGRVLQEISIDRNTIALFRIIPPQWDTDNNLWLAPWQMLESGKGSPETAAYIESWKAMAVAYRAQDVTGWQNLTRQALKQAKAMANPQTKLYKLALEDTYTRLAPFTKSLYLYILAFLIVTGGKLSSRPAIIRAGLYFLAAGFILHLTGMGARIVIMERPPVTTLYESILFVSLVSVAVSVFLERQWRNGSGILLGSVAGITLNLLSLKYAANGDTMELLPAVLNTNFWLATHVLTITMGYGFAFIAGAVAHMYLLQRWFHPRDEDGHERLFGSLVSMCRIALLFSVAGTVLGGIWADQSWGRFWGWDPKENGALLIILWLLWLMHGRRTNHVGPLAFSTGLALTTVIVAIAWFGVNMLGVGLHSYGFDKGKMLMLVLFSGAEVLFAASMFSLLKIRESRLELVSK